MTDPRADIAAKATKTGQEVVSAASARRPFETFVVAVGAVIIAGMGWIMLVKIDALDDKVDAMGAKVATLEHHTHPHAASKEDVAKTEQMLLRALETLRTEMREGFSAAEENHRSQNARIDRLLEKR